MAGNKLTSEDGLLLCHVTKYSTILGVFWQPCPAVSTSAPRHFESGEGPGDEFVESGHGVGLRCRIEV